MSGKMFNDKLNWLWIKLFIGAGVFVLFRFPNVVVFGCWEM